MCDIIQSTELQEQRYSRTRMSVACKQQASLATAQLITAWCKLCSTITTKSASGLQNIRNKLKTEI